MFLLFNSYTPHFFLIPKQLYSPIFFIKLNSWWFWAIFESQIDHCGTLHFPKVPARISPPTLFLQWDLQPIITVSRTSALLVWDTHSGTAATTPWGSPNRPVQGPHWETIGRRASTIAHTTARHVGDGVSLRLQPSATEPPQPASQTRTHSHRAETIIPLCSVRISGPQNSGA